MTALKNVTLGLAALYIIRFLFSLLAPEKYRNAIKTVLSLIAVVTVAVGIVNVDLSDIYSQFRSIGGDISFSEADSLILGELNGKLSDYICSLLSEEGIESEKVSVVTTIDENRCISITKASITLGSEYKNDEYAVRNLIRNKIGDIELIISFVEV